MKFRSIMAVAALGLLLAGPTFAKGEVSPLITGADVEEILNVARGYGSANIAEQSNGDPMISGKVDGLTYQIYFQGCTGNKDCQDLMFYLGFLDIQPGIEKMNEWNQTERLSRAYIDGDDDACIEFDVALREGVSFEYLDSMMGIWVNRMSDFAQYVGYK